MVRLNLIFKSQERPRLPIGDVLGKFNVLDDPFSFSPMGRHIAKLNFEYIDKLKEKVFNSVTAITPTPRGRKTTTLLV